MTDDRPKIRGLLPAPPPSLTITKEHDSSTFTVRLGNRYEDRLTREESLYCAAQFILGGDQKYLKTADEHEQRSTFWKRHFRPSGPVVECRRCSRANMAQTYHYPPSCD